MNRATARRPLRPAVPGEELKVVLDVLKCFRCYASASYAEGAANVTHAEAVFEDLK